MPEVGLSATWRENEIKGFNFEFDTPYELEKQSRELHVSRSKDFIRPFYLQYAQMFQPYSSLC